MGLAIKSITKYEPVDGYDDDVWSIHKMENPEPFDTHLAELSEHSYVMTLEEGNSVSIGYGRFGWFREFLAELEGYEPLRLPMPGYSDPNFDDNLYKHHHPHLARFYNEEIDLDKGFSSIIYFSDCEGYIGNRFCKLLDKAFEEHGEKAAEHNFYPFYQDLAKTVKDAAESGGFLLFT